MPLERAVEQYDELPEVGSKILFNGQLHVVTKRSIIQKIDDPEPKLTIKLAYADEELMIHAEIDSEEEIKKQAKHLVE